MIKPPCKDKDGTDCPNRTVGCHATCEQYRTFCEKKAQERKYNHEEAKRAVDMAYEVYRTKKHCRNISANQRRLMGQR